MTRISTSLLPLWSKSPPEQGSLVSPHFPTNRSTPSPTPWSIRHSCHLQTTLQPPSPFPYALPPNLDRITHGHPPRDQQDRPTAPSNHPPRLSLRRRPRLVYAFTTGFLTLKNTVLIPESFLRCDRPQPRLKSQGSLLQVALNPKHQHYVLHHTTPSTSGAYTVQCLFPSQKCIGKYWAPVT